MHEGFLHEVNVLCIVLKWDRIGYNTITYCWSHLERLYGCHVEIIDSRRVKT
jgi:hypothetical protein